MTRAAIASLALVLAMVACGCGGHEWSGLWRDDFETTCAGTPCGWTQVAGTPGSVTWIETGPSEHGVQLVGTGVAISRDTAGEQTVMAATVSSLKAHVVARCDVGAQLTLIVTVHNPAPGAMPIDVTGSATYPSEWDGTRTTFDLFPDDSTDMATTFDDILAVVLHKEGTGSCEVDYVSLSDANVPFQE